MQAGSIWKRFRRRLRYWLDRSERNRLLSEEMEFHIASMIDELVAQGMPEPEAIAAAYRKFGNMTQISRRGSLHLDRALDERSRAGSAPRFSRHAARCRIYGVYNSHRRTRHRRQLHGLQCSQRAATAPAPFSRSRTRLGSGLAMASRTSTLKPNTIRTSGGSTDHFQMWPVGPGTTARATANLRESASLSVSRAFRSPGTFSNCWVCSR